MLARRPAGSKSPSQCARCVSRALFVGATGLARCAVARVGGELGSSEPERYLAMAAPGLRVCVRGVRRALGVTVSNHVRPVSWQRWQLRNRMKA